MRKMSDATNGTKKTLTEEPTNMANATMSGGTMFDEENDAYSVGLHSINDSKEASEYDTDSNGKSGRDGAAGTGLEYEVGKRETKAVGGLRWCVFFVLVISMTLVAVTTYFYLRNEEIREFEEKFEGDSFKILSSLGASIDKAIAGVDAYVVTMLSYARETNQTWPFVTIPDFEARSAKFLALTR